MDELVQGALGVLLGREAALALLAAPAGDRMPADVHDELPRAPLPDVSLHCWPPLPARCREQLTAKTGGWRAGGFRIRCSHREPGRRQPLPTVCQRRRDVGVFLGLSQVRAPGGAWTRTATPDAAPTAAVPAFEALTRTPGSSGAASWRCWTSLLTQDPIPVRGGEGYRVRTPESLAQRSG
jgi:hypothetical protein